MRLKPGDPVIPVELPAIDGSRFNSASWAGKRYMLSFYRFATCPFCNLRLHELISRSSEFGGDFQMIAIFDSPLDHLQRNAARHEARFPILADGENVYYRKYGIERSIAGMLKGMTFRMPTLMYSMLVKGFIPLRFKGNLLTMPADFLVDENGVIQTAYYGKDEGDHLPIEEIVPFSMKKNQ